MTRLRQGNLACHRYAVPATRLAVNSSAKALRIFMQPSLTVMLGTQCRKPTVSEWFIPPIYGVGDLLQYHVIAMLLHESLNRTRTNKSEMDRNGICPLGSLACSVFWADEVGKLNRRAPSCIAKSQAHPRFFLLLLSVRNS